MVRVGLNANASSILRTTTEFTIYLFSIARPILGRFLAVEILVGHSTIKTITFTLKLQGMIRYIMFLCNTFRFVK